MDVTPTGNRLRAMVERIVTKAIAPLIAYRTTYLCQVVSQNDDKSIDVKPVGRLGSSLFPSGITNVVIRGLPGVVVTVAPGTLVELEFEDADPGTPVATLFDTTGLLSMTITAQTAVIVAAPSVAVADGAQLGIVRAGDVVTITIDAIDLLQFFAPPGTAGGPLTLAPGLTSATLVGQALTASQGATAGA